MPPTFAFCLGRMVRRVRGGTGLAGTHADICAVDVVEDTISVSTQQFHKTGYSVPTT